MFHAKFNKIPFIVENTILSYLSHQIFLCSLSFDGYKDNQNNSLFQINFNQLLKECRLFQMSYH